MSADSPPGTTDTVPHRTPVILSRAEHCISRSKIDENALKVMYRLAASGYLAYLVGGGVRDLLLGKVPKDFDVSTDAKPSRIKRIFRNCRIIGRRFRIAHVYFPNGDIIELSTFRHGNQRAIQTDRGVILTDNEYGTPEEDALRRDITINGLFYDIGTFSVIDYVGGIEDLKNRIIRTIAEPNESFREDPVRMIRVERHAARTGFEIEAETLRAVYQNRAEIRNANPARLLEETLKDLRGGAARPFYQILMQTHVLDNLLPMLGEQLRAHGPEHPFWRRMEALDRRVQSGTSFTTPVLLALMLHTVLFPEPQSWTGQRGHPPDVWRSIQTSWREISRTVRISRRDMERVAQILICHRKLLQSVERRRLLPALFKKSYLSEALDFLEVDLESRATSPGAPPEGLPGATALHAPEMIRDWRKHAPPPPRVEPRYHFAPARRGARRGDHGADDAPDGDLPEGGLEDEGLDERFGDDPKGPRDRETDPGHGPAVEATGQPQRPRSRRRRRSRRRGRRARSEGGASPPTV